MNKLTCLIAPLMLLLAANAYGTKYEYFRMTADNPTLELGGGDVAEVVNYTATMTSKGYFVDMLVGSETFQYRLEGEYIYSEQARPLTQIPSLFIGECTLKMSNVHSSITFGDDKDMVIFRIQRASDTGSTTLAQGTGTSSDTTSENTDSETETAQIDYDNFSNWAYFSSYPWVYNYDNRAWYYMQSTKDGLFAYNSNVSGNGWLKVGGVN